MQDVTGTYAIEAEGITGTLVLAEYQTFTETANDVVATGAYAFTLGGPSTEIILMRDTEVAPVTETQTGTRNLTISRRALTRSGNGVTVVYRKQ